MFLFINTAENNKTQVALINIKKDDNIEIIKKISSKARSDRLLILIDKLLKAKKTTPQRLKGIFVVKGPGGFTAVRIGVAIANSFSYGLNIPVFGIKFEESKEIKELIKKEIKKIKNIKSGKIVKPIENV
ncbi:tRNA (adenosine(37)-N6)-threonylcarbamoyltransferase complex dimerization subunit type 1 TsaB [Candidatus Falkowbacteria bacterium]|jgi:tRNA threonylcarbamoyl adenosine modification protein YeaZ|nr:tRNA (adenosine(37)-N6)-threonylcarbamoyltransferase complex dimerization subunit type 1 TsaB [Candidatus Falkowbacteria bacterium]MBT4433496.1 tRNA (adenosine(37)-N6)-threonylcarbamoyltransferase complex dimerization subunit type 1 TsaB [Candidatus Falkowbacteria bacterium]